MSSQVPLAAAATLVSVAFMLSTLERYLAARRRHQLMWTVSLAMFALGSFGLWLGASIGWTELSFKWFYLFGAILNVPYLALGTWYLLGIGKPDRVLAVVSLLAAFAAGIVVASPIVHPEALTTAVVPSGKEVFDAGPRILAAVGSGVAALVILGGAIWSAFQLMRRRERPRLAIANILIGIGTLVLSLGGVLNSVLDEMTAFSVSLVVGISIIFGGFLLTNEPAPVETDLES